MAERRTLIEGLDTMGAGERTLEEQFVYGKKARRAVAEAPAPAPAAEGQPAPATTGETPAETPAGTGGQPRPAPLLGLGRVPVGARIRTELASALKRASLERQLHGLEPYTVQDILEEALEPWLRRHGYLK